MYLAHTGVALGATATDDRVSLGWWLLAAWAFDITGVGHWLPFAVLLAGAAFVLGRRRWDARAGVLLGAVVVSHDLLDLVVGVQVLPGGSYVGLNLDRGVGVELALELAVIGGGAVAYVRARQLSLRANPLVLVALAAVVVASIAAAIAGGDGADDETDPTTLAALATGAIATSALLLQADRRSDTR